MLLAIALIAASAAVLVGTVALLVRIEDGLS